MATDPLRPAGFTLARTKDDWRKIFITQTDGTAEGIGRRIIGDLWGYNTAARYNKFRDQDVMTLANALAAYHDLMSARELNITF